MKSIFGLDEKLVAALSYLLGPFSGIIVLVLERDNKFVRFHALQSTLWFLFVYVILWVISVVAGLTGIPIIGLLVALVLWPIRWVVRTIMFLSKLFLMFKAGTGSEFKLPFVGDVAWNQVNK